MINESITNEDTLYYLIQSQDKCNNYWVFTEYEHLFAHLTDSIVGKCIYMHKTSYGTLDVSAFKTKTINKLDYINLAYILSNNHQYVNNTDAAIERLISEESALLCEKKPCVLNENFSWFKRDLVVTRVNAREALSVARTQNPILDSIADQIQKEFQLEEHNLGITGSAALGCALPSDYDFVFYGNTDELVNIKQRIDYYIVKNGAVNEYGLRWPCRFFDDEHRLICCFFNNTSTSYIDFLTDPQTSVSKNETNFCVKVKDDSHSVSKNPLLLLEGGEYESLIAFSTAFKGVLKNGDIICGHGYVLHHKKNGQNVKSILCINPFSDIQNAVDYFKRD